MIDSNELLDVLIEDTKDSSENNYEYDLIFREYYHRVLAYCIVTLEDLNIYAEDIAQNVFVTAFVDEKIRLFHRKSSLFTWLCGIANNIIRRQVHSHNLHDQLLRENVEKISINTHSNFNFYEHFIKNLIELNKYIDQLDYKDKGVINMYFFHDVSIQDIAKKQGKSISAIYRQINRITERLKKMMISEA